MILKVSNEEDFPKDFQINYHTHLICHRDRVDFLLMVENRVVRAVNFYSGLPKVI